MRRLVEWDLRPKGLITGVKTLMLTEEQLRYFNVFGFVLLKSLLTTDELRIIQSEFDHRAEVVSSYEDFDGTKRQYFNMMGKDTPFLSSLMEDPRFVGVAEQMFGDVLGRGSDGNRYVKNTFWHYDPGTPEAYGVKFAIYLQPMRADNGALRLIPGSHKNPWFVDLDKHPPLRYAWVRQHYEKAESDEVISSVPGYVCETDPGDVVAFDDRIYHASVGGSNDRHQCDITYLRYPRTPRELAATISLAKDYMNERDNSADPWNPKRTAPDDWFANKGRSSMRQRWIEGWKEISEMKEGENGFKTVPIDGKSKVVPA